MTPNIRPLAVRGFDIQSVFDTLNCCAVVPHYTPVATVQ